jgi:glutaredoxin
MMTKCERQTSHRQSVRVQTALRLAALLLFAAVAPALGAEPVPRIAIHVFKSKGCPHCESVEKDALAKLSKQLGCDIVPAYHDVDDMTEYKRLVLLERRYRKTGNDLPVAFIGPRLLGGNKEIDAQLEPSVRELLRAGNSGEIALPSAGEIAAAWPAGQPAETPPIYITYFEQPGCRHCRRAEHLINFYLKQQPAIKLQRFMSMRRENKLLLEVLCEKAHVSEDERLVVPAIFIGDDSLIRDQITDEAMERLLHKYSTARSGKIWEVGEPELAAARERVRTRFHKVGFAAVAVGGLIDGINPCAFASIIFFITYLAAIGRARRTLLYVGVAFCAGVFVAYFTVGIGISETLLQLEMLPWIAVIIRWLTVALLAVLCLASLYDAAIAWRGRAREMLLKLPHGLRMRINQIVIKSSRSAYLVPASFVLGLAVSMLELACTGQVYLPLIQLMLTVSLERAQTLFLLTLYNLAFVLPLVGVFLAAFFGVRSEGLGDFLKRYIVPAKLALACFFAALAFVLILLTK